MYFISRQIISHKKIYHLEFKRITARNINGNIFKLIPDFIKMSSVRVKINSIDIEMLNNICNTIKDLAKKSGIVISGPIPLPTKKLKITTRKSPCGNGTATFDRFEMRIHRRVIDLPANEKVLHGIMRLQIPKNVNIKIEVKD